jgi:hypothetical protein
MRQFLLICALAFLVAPLVIMQILSPTPEQIANQPTAGLIWVMFAVSWILALMMLHLRSKTVE